MTSVNLPGCFGSGLADFGRKTPNEMIAQIRSYAKTQKDIMELILSSPDADFRVQTYVGTHSRKQLEILQDGKDARS